MNVRCNLSSSLRLFCNIFSKDDIAPYGFVWVDFFGNSKKVPISESKLIQPENKNCSYALRNQRTEGQWAVGLWVVWPQWEFQFCHGLPDEVVRMSVCGPRPWRGWWALSWAEWSLCKLWTCQLWDLSALLGLFIKRLPLLGRCFA